MKTIKLLIIVSIFLSSVFVNADLQDALEAYESQNYESAHKQFLQLAEVGNADAFYNLGVMYFKGQHVEQDHIQAYAWMKLASQVDDYFKTGVVEKKLDKQQITEANKRFSDLNQRYGLKAFNNRLLPLFNTTEEYFYNKDLRKPLIKVAPIYPKRAVERAVPGIVIVSYRVNPDGNVSDIEILSEYPQKYNFAKAALGSTKKFKYTAWDATIEDAQRFYYMTNIYKFDVKMSIQQKDAFDNLVTSANTNNAKAQYALANYITPIHNVIVTPYLITQNKRHKFEIPKLKAQGNELLLSAAMNGDIKAQVFLGMRLIQGDDIKQDKKKGMNWLKQAASNGSEYAEKQLGFLDSLK